MRVPQSQALLAALALAAAVPALADDTDFSGAWVGWLCPAGAQRDSGKCSNFVLELHQKNGRLCGAHTFSTADATQVDEGMAPSISGEVVGAGANLTVVSTLGKSPVSLRAELKRVGTALEWRRLDSPDGEYLLPQTARLSKAKKKSLFAPIFEQQLRANCLSAFTVAEQNALQQQTPPAPAAK
jgi:hypothetical protein